MLQNGQILRVIDPMGEQVSGLFSMDAKNHASYLSSGRTIDCASKYLLSTFNIFMNVSFEEHGGVSVNCRLSKAGDFIELRT